RGAAPARGAASAQAPPGRPAAPCRRRRRAAARSLTPVSVSAAEGPHMAKPAAVIFDAYGTLFDVHSVIEAGRAVTSDPQALSLLWRQKQLEYTWLRSLMGRYEDFWTVTEQALRFALRRLGIAAGEAQVKTLLEAYLSLACFPEVADALARLEGAPLGILSNGSPRMLAAALRSSGLQGALRHVLSVDAVKIYKPSPRV